MDKKIIMILVDGMRPDYIMSNTNPYIRTFLSQSVYTMEARTVMPSVTLPCHTSLFLSVPPERHGILTNTWVPQVRPVKGLVEVLNEAGKLCAFIYYWEPLRDLSQPGYLGFSYFTSGKLISCEKSLTISISRASEIIKKESPDFMFIYIGLPDARGHAFGFTTEEYAESISLAWDGIRSITGLASTDYGVVVLADHGGHGRSHGEDIAEDMTIPVILYGELFKNADMSAGVSIIDVAPTIAEAMGVNPDAEWEGRSMYRGG